jgi:GNAT superfamily N-acetyltransferase
MTTLERGDRVRLATIGDAAAIAGHRARMFQEMGSLSDAEAPAIEAETRAQLEALLASGEYRGWLIERDNAIVAGAGVFLHRLLPRHGNPEGRPEAYILNVYTEPAHRRRGLARRLIEEILAWCLEQGIPRASLHASVYGRSVYERLGFAPTNEMRMDTGATELAAPKPEAKAGATV